MGEATSYNLPEAVRSTVFKESESLEGASSKIEGYDFNKGVDYGELFKSMAVTGFQASNLGDAIQLVNEMVFRGLVDYLEDSPLGKTGKRSAAALECEEIGEDDLCVNGP